MPISLTTEFLQPFPLVWLLCAGGMFCCRTAGVTFVMRRCCLRFCSATTIAGTTTRRKRRRERATVDRKDKAARCGLIYLRSATVGTSCAISYARLAPPGAHRAQRKHG